MILPKILVCGGRDFNNKDYLYNTLDNICEERGWEYEPDKYGNFLPAVEIISGMANGADKLAYNWAIINWCRVREFPADWNKYGKSAGPIRNEEMLIKGKPDLVIAFPTSNSKGTWHMVKIAKEANIETIIKET